MLNPVYIRLAVYVLSALAGLIPAEWAGLVSYQDGIIQISLEGLAAAIVGGLALSGAVFKRWGVK